MKLREHVVLGGAAAAGLTPVLGAQDSLVFLGATVLIDVDHYWDYLVRNDFRNWSWPKTFAFHRALFPKIHDADFLALNFFHTVEAFVIVLVAGSWLGSSAALAAFLGMAYHLALDLAFLTWHRATFKRALSYVEYHLRRRRLLRRGLDPDRVYREALAEIGVSPLPRPQPAEVDAPS